MMKQRTLTYWRTSWVGDAGQRPTLESMVRNILATCSTVAGSAFERADNSKIEIRHQKSLETQPIFLHMVGYMPGAEGSVVPNVADDADFGPLSSVPPPTNSNFLGGSMALMVIGNDCIFCAENMNINTFRLYLQSISRRLGRPSSEEQFEFVPVPDRDIIKQLDAQDVVSIGLDVTLDEYDTNMNLVESETFTLKQRLLAAIRDFFEKDDQIRQLRDMDLSNVNARISLKLDGRYRSGMNQLDFDRSAREILNDLEPGFYIKTRNGSKISHDSLRLSKSIEVAVANETIDHTSAWLRMEEFHAELVGLGYIRRND
jgi:hypothetical protein